MFCCIHIYMYINRTEVIWCKEQVLRTSYVLWSFSSKVKRFDLDWIYTLFDCCSWWAMLSSFWLLLPSVRRTNTCLKTLLLLPVSVKKSLFQTCSSEVRISCTLLCFHFSLKFYRFYTHLNNISHCIYFMIWNSLNIVMLTFLDKVISYFLHIQNIYSKTRL